MDIKLETGTSDRVENFVRETWRLALGREPDTATLQAHCLDLERGRDPISYFSEINRSEEATRLSALRREVPEFVPAGHYYSPIVNPKELRDTGFREQRHADPMCALKIDYGRMERFFLSVADQEPVIDFVREEPNRFRYRVDNDFFGIGDAIILSGIIQRFRPKNIVEVGCGYSTAVMLDTLDRMPRAATQCVLIDPSLDRAKSILREEDYERVTLIERPVQRVDQQVFQELLYNDILFFDTTHVVKTGSDSIHVLFQILPELAPGVLIHFHDIFAGFEYPDSWIFRDNRSWNEAYLLRAFLMYNDSFEILFFSDAFARNRHSKVAEVREDILKNPGGSLWLRKR